MYPSRHILERSDHWMWIYIMNNCRYRFPLLALLFFMIAACATTPVAPDAEHLATAKRFLHSWSAGELALAALRRKLESEATEQPGMVELARRVFADLKAEEFEDWIARIYARHLTQGHLAELARFTESQAGNRFFRMVVAQVLEGKSIETKDVMRQFNADELTVILKLSQSDALAAMKQAMPAINREMAEEAKRFGQARLREYLERQ